MVNFFNNGPKCLKFVVRVRIYHNINMHLEKKLLI